MSSLWFELTESTAASARSGLDSSDAAKACPDDIKKLSASPGLESSCTDCAITNPKFANKVKRELVQYFDEGHIALVSHYFDSRGHL